MIVLKANIRTFNWFAESQKLHNSHFLGGTPICVLFLPAQWEQWTKWTQLLLQYFTSYVQTFYQHCLTSACWWVRKDWKEKELSSLLCHRFGHRWLANTGKENEYEMIWQGFLSLVFERTPLPPFCIQSKFWFKQHDLSVLPVSPLT